jgi:hypothetical protein
MQIIPISQALTQPNGTILAGVRGNIKAVGEYATGVQQLPDGAKREWSVQTIILEQDGAEIAAEVSHKPAVPASAVGRGVHLLSQQREGGTALVGVKIVIDGGRTFLRVTAKGELVLADVAANLGGKPTNSPSLPEGGAKAKAAPLAAQSTSGSGQVAPATAAPATSADPAAVIAPGTLSPKARRERITELVLLYDECLMAVLAGVGTNLGKEMGMMMNPDLVHQTTIVIFKELVHGDNPF